MIVEDLDNWLAGITARKQDLAGSTDDDALRNDGTRRTLEKRELLRRAEARAVAAGRKPVRSNF